MWKKHFLLWDGVTYLKATSHFSFQTFISKAVICILHWVWKSVSLLEGIRNVTNLIKPNFLSLYLTCIVYVNPQKMDSLLGKDLSNLLSAKHKVWIFPSAILSKSPDLLVIELIFGYKNILLRFEFRRRFSITLMFPR